MIPLFCLPLGTVNCGSGCRAKPSAQGLLDQNIFRPDEIWFAQKDSEQATQLYPLSDYNIHKTANIENGYLIGRYGGIPFLSNLKDLHW